MNSIGDEADVVMQMYEAQAIVIEQDAVIDELQKSKEELEAKLKHLELRGNITFFRLQFLHKII